MDRLTNVRLAWKLPRELTASLRELFNVQRVPKNRAYPNGAARLEEP